MNKMLRIFSLFLVLIISLPGLAQKLAVLKLTCENAEAPLGIEKESPLLSWQLASTNKSVLQTAYRILVADDPGLLAKNEGNIWDSKKVGTDQSLHIAYAGKKLLPVKTYYWKVMAWDNKGTQSAWSPVSYWQMGLPAKQDWKGAQWIAYEKLPDSLLNILPTDGKKDTYNGNNVLPLLRKSFVAKKGLKKATLFIAGLGHFEAYLNGKKIGDHFLDPGWTKYDKQALYVPFDVTHAIRDGENAIGVMLGNGFYYIPPVKGRYRKLKGAFGYPKMICRLALEFEDGSREEIISDASWKTTPGPITFSSIYGGEDYNALLEKWGWNEPAYDDAAWKRVVTVEGPPQLHAQQAAPLKVMQAFTPQKQLAVGTGRWVFDLGQNASGIPAIQVKGKRGDTVRIYPGELVKEDGSVTQKVTGGPHYLQYILKGEGVESWQPWFTYYGFRYLQVDGAVPKGEKNVTGLPELIGVKGLHIRNSAPTVGTFHSSNELFNRTHSLVDWAIRSNMVSVFTDCPHREKLGWLEQAHLMGNSVRYTYDVATLYQKQLLDMRYSQTDSGLIPAIAPEYVKFEWGGDMFRDTPEWGSNAIIIPWYLYQWYGNKAVLQENYDVMQRYAAYLKIKAKKGILSQGLGDWYDLGPKPPGVSQLTPMGVTGTAMYYYDLRILSRIARLLDKPGDATAYEKEAMAVRKAFNKTFFNAATKQYATGSQTANAMAVYMNLVEPKHKQAVIENIIKDIRSRNNSFTAGDVGYRYLLCVLHDAGRDDVIFDMNSRSDVPGYGYQLANGATALTESWKALPTNSNNHFMLGHLMEWFYRALAGLGQSPHSIAHKEIVIHPRIVGDVTFASGHYDSPYGLIATDWKKEKDRFSLNVTVPVNTTAVVYLPGDSASAIRENNRPIKENPHIRIEGKESGKTKLRVGSGTFNFVVTNLVSKEFAAK
ncbi:family 78 glycoside hydrolase catalytic domain [Flavisolibacter sp. BT320]|nr:family 78 glycoside hydrolase catalytic domain [Flavisolibacter longurius]